MTPLNKQIYEKNVENVEKLENYFCFLSFLHTFAIVN